MKKRKRKLHTVTIDAPTCTLTCRCHTLDVDIDMGMRKIYAHWYDRLLGRHPIDLQNCTDRGEPPMGTISGKFNIIKVEAKV